MGPVNGAIRNAFTTLSKIQAKQDLSFAVILGDLFTSLDSAVGSDDVPALLNGDIRVPLPTYFTIGREPLPAEVVTKLEISSNELCHNLFFLGRRSTFKTSEGIRIVNLGGSYTQKAAGVTDYLPLFTENDARILHGANNADILLSNEWPLGVTSGSQTAKDDIGGNPLPASQQCISNLCSTLKPRYHFSVSSGFFYEREPFHHPPSDPNSNARPVTRFISLGFFKNLSGAKFVYAFALDPSDTVTASTTKIPLSTTLSPFAPAQKRRPLPDQYSGYASSYGQDGQNSYHRGKRKFAPAGPEECFFCVSNPKFEKHMVVSIGDESYITISKGPLPTSTTFPALNSAFPGHMLIIPLNHNSTLSGLSDPKIRAATFQEMSRYRRAMDSMLLHVTATAVAPDQKLTTVTFEVSRARVRHLGWQWLPVPAHFASKGLVEAAFRVKAGDLGFAPFVDIDPNVEVGLEVGEYFRVWLPVPSSSDANAKVGETNSGGVEQPAWEIKSMYTPIAPEQSFDLQFGRKVMAGLLQVEGREKWDLVRQSVTEETECAKRFKDAFTDFDFTLQE